MNASRPPDNESNESVTDIRVEQITPTEPSNNDEEYSATRIAHAWRNHR
jgi:hypothetical protein